MPYGEADSGRAPNTTLVIESISASSTASPLHLPLSFFNSQANRSRRYDQYQPHILWCGVEAAGSIVKSLTSSTVRLESDTSDQQLHALGTESRIRVTELPTRLISPMVQNSKSLFVCCPVHASPSFSRHSPV